VVTSDRHDGYRPERSCTAEANRRAFSLAPIEENLVPLERLLSGKRSVREFKDQPLDRDTITL